MAQPAKSTDTTSSWEDDEIVYMQLAPVSASISASLSEPVSESDIEAPIDRYANYRQVAPQVREPSRDINIVSIKREYRDAATELIGPCNPSAMRATPTARLQRRRSVAIDMLAKHQSGRMILDMIQRGQSKGESPDIITRRVRDYIASLKHSDI